MSVLLFVIIILASWRITHLFSIEDGPFDIIFLLRKKAGTGFFGSLMDCFYCTSIWVSLPFGIYAGNNRVEQLLYWLAISGAACLLEQATAKPQQPSTNQIQHYKED